MRRSVFAATVIADHVHELHERVEHRLHLGDDHHSQRQHRTRQRRVEKHFRLMSGADFIVYMFYFILSCIGVIVFLTNYKRFFKNEAL